MQLSDYCIVIDNHMDDNTCNDIIELFHEESESHGRHQAGSSFDVYNFTQNENDNSQLYDTCIGYLLQAIQEYRYRIKDFAKWTPDGKTTEFGCEDLRVKCYHDYSKDHFIPHVDATNWMEARRYLTFIWFLNNADGGDFMFDNFEMKIIPKKGSILIFPPLWLFPHKTAEVKSGEKYILHTYLHYIDK